MENSSRGGIRRWGGGSTLEEAASAMALEVEDGGNYGTLLVGGEDGGGELEALERGVG
jgi:hypothetical protein